MSFPSHDPYWTEVAAFLDTHATDNDDILAPRAFEYRLTHTFRYVVSQTAAPSGFQWVVIHKGMLDDIHLPFLLDTLKQYPPVYTNAVFVVLSAHDHLPRVQDNDDLFDFNQKLRDLVQTQSIIPTAVPDSSESVMPLANTDLKISIITICRNAAETIAATLKSVADQTYSNLEYIVVDGDSEDETLAVCDRYSSAITTLVSEPDDGIYNAMNKGIGLATGEPSHFISNQGLLPARCSLVQFRFFTLASTHKYQPLKS